MSRNGGRFESMSAAERLDNERYNMDVALESTPTSEMLSELEAANFALPTDDELTELSKRMNGWLEQKRHDEGQARSHTWFNLFKEIDQDGSGFITYDELENVIRFDLKKSHKEISTKSLKALWCVLDKDLSNQVRSRRHLPSPAYVHASYSETRASPTRCTWTRRRASSSAAPPRGTRRSPPTSSASDALNAERYNMDRAIAGPTTKGLRAELAAASVSLPNPDEQARDLAAISHHLPMCMHLTAYRAPTSRSRSPARSTRVSSGRGTSRSRPPRQATIISSRRSTRTTRASSPSTSSRPSRARRSA